MYQYSPEDSNFLVERVDQFEKQLKRHLAGDLDDAKFRSLRLRNGLLSPQIKSLVPEKLFGDYWINGLFIWAAG